MEKSFFTDFIKNQEDISEIENLCLSIYNKNKKLIIFPRKIENAFRQFFFTSDKIKNIVFLIIAGVFFNLFALMDKIMIKDIYLFAWNIRFFIMTPLSIICIYLIWKTQKPFIMNLIVTFILVSSAASLLVMVNSSDYYLAHQYHSGIFLICIAGLLIFKISFFNKIIFSVLILLTNISFFIFNTNIYPESKTNIISVLASLIAIAMIAALEREITTRKIFIKTLLQEITNYSLEKKTRYLNDLSNRDELTNLANRRFFKKHLKRLISQTGNGIFPIAVLYADIDNFKKYNDNYGHNKGDVCLKKVAQVFDAYTNRRFDLASRWGGEEFLLIFPFTGESEALIIAEKIRKAVEDLKIEHKYSDVSPYLTISIGLSCLIQSENNKKIEIDTIINEADKALYKVKNSGKNGVFFFRS
jgi:diguanylate cyclase (GGDEF)-like protein